jgi:3'(2'), 5'-bisphosphate nucleotidase
MDPHADAELARRVATDAGGLLLRVRDAGSSADANGLRAAGDRAAHRFVAAELTAARPHDAVFSEEAHDDGLRLKSNRVWIIDPLDGTREFAEGRSDWAVHVALWADGDLIVGAVALPARAVTLATNDVPAVPERRDGRLRIAVSRSRPPAVAEEAAKQLDAELVPMGSAGFKVASVVLGDVDAYVHAGGQFEWDSAAPVAVARAAGLHATRLDGASLEYNRPDPYLPDLLVCRQELAAALLAACRPTTRSVT